MSKKLIALFISSIVFPMAVLTGLRLTGFMPGPIIVSETTTAPLAEWEMEIPSQIYGIDHSIGNSYSSSEISTHTNLSIWDYSGGEFYI